jgi:hypothetical protein
MIKSVEDNFVTFRFQGPEPLHEFQSA